MSALPESITQPLPQAITAKMPVIEDGEYSILFDTAKFEQAYRVARLFSASKFVPEAYQGSPENCFVALQMATRLRVDPMMFMQKTYIVHNKPGMEATLAIALINARGPFTGPIQWRLDGSGMDRTCIAYAKHKITGEVCEAECSMQMAKAEGWLDKAGSKWKTLPDLMLRYRSASFLARLYAPECLMGLLTVDELDDVTPKGEIDVTPKTEPARRGAAAMLREVATRSIAEQKIDRDTGEIKTDDDEAALRAGAERTAGDSFDPPGAGAPSDDELVALIKAGNYDDARAIAGPKLNMVEGMIASHMKAQEQQQQRPSARRTARNVVSPE